MTSNPPHLSGFKKAIAFLAVSLSSFLAIGLGIWWIYGFWGYLAGVVLGMVALFIGNRWIYRTSKNSNLAFLIGFIGFIQVFCVAAILIIALPPLKLGLSLPETAQPLRLEQLSKERPALPAYVQLTGELKPSLTIRDVYTPKPTKETSNPKPQKVDYVPLVPPHWTPQTPVNVVIKPPKLGVRGDRLTVQGVLYPVVPRGNEAGPLASQSLTFSLDGFGYGLSWFQKKSDFAIDPEYFFLLMDETPQEMRVNERVLFGLFAIYGIAVMAAFLWVDRPKRGNP